LVEGPAQELVRRIRKKGEFTSWSNAYGPYLHGVVWSSDKQGVFYFTPLMLDDYINWEKLELAESPAQAKPSAAESAIISESEAKIRRLVLEFLNPGNENEAAEIARMFLPYADLNELDLRKIIHKGINTAPGAARLNFKFNENEISAVRSRIRAKDKDSKIVVVTFGPGKDSLELKTTIDEVLSRGKKMKLTLVAVDKSVESLLECGKKLKDYISSIPEKDKQGSSIEIVPVFGDITDENYWPQVVQRADIFFWRSTHVGLYTGLNKLKSFALMLWEKLNSPGALVIKERGVYYGETDGDDQWVISEIKRNATDLPPDIIRYSGVGPEAAESPAQAKPSAAEKSASPLNDNIGGIDFRALPIVTQAVNNLGVGFRDSALRGQSLLQLSNVNLDAEWRSMEQMASSGIKLSSERLKEYAQSSSAQGNIARDRDKIIQSISDILRQEEDECCETDPVLRDILVVLDSIQQPEALKEAFLGKA
jgi:hypothetical protein